LNRINKDGKDLAAFLTNNEAAPDVIFVSEVRMPAAGLPSSSSCSKATTARRRGELAKNTPTQSREATEITTFLRKYNYRPYWSLADNKYAGTALLVRRDVTPPTSIRYSLDNMDTPPSTIHHVEGRVILASFDDFDLLGTYVPNNGVTEISFGRRREWDAEMGTFLRARQQRMSSMASSSSSNSSSSSSTPSTTATAAAATTTTTTTIKPLVLLGDMNVASTWEDVGPSPNWFRNKNGQDAIHINDRGQPGFTINEQKRFNNLLEIGNLVDAYRLVHPIPNWSIDVTWRGAPGVDIPKISRYYGKGMRIDYILVSQELLASYRVMNASLYGKGGVMRDGFLGSDHCPLLLTIEPITS
jgi:exonuclease III